MKKAKTVDEYINQCPIEYQAKLKDLRKLIKEVLPSAEERISYGMPYYGYKGPVVYFALQKKHLGLYIPPPIIDYHKEELKDYGTTKSSVHLYLEKPLPKELIIKLIKARIKYNENSKNKKGIYV